MKPTPAAAAAIVALAAALPLAPPDVARAADFGGNRVAVIVKATTSQFWATVFEGADMAGRVLGVQVSKLGTTAETDAQGQVAILESTIAAKPNAIVIAATNAAALAAPVAHATDLGIPVIV